MAGTSYMFRGRACWISADVGAALGYDPGGFRNCYGNWSDEIIDGKDAETLRGDDLRDFKDLLDVSVKSTLSRAPNLTILYESGVHVVCLKTEKPLGRQLRRHLADEVLPKLVRGEPILPQSVASEWSTEALAYRKAALLQQIANDLSPAVSQEARDALRANAAVLLTGDRLAPLLPRLPGGQWHRPTEIAEMLGVTANAVGRAISALGLRGSEHSRAVMDKKANANGQVVAYTYDETALERIREHFAKAQKSAA